MIKNFEEYTEPLTDLEIAAARKVWKLLNANPTHWFTNQQIIDNAEPVFKAPNKPLKLTPRRCRKIIGFLHREGHAPFLVASPKGTKFRGTKQELVDYALGLEGRVSAIAARLRVTQSAIQSIQEQ